MRKNLFRIVINILLFAAVFTVTLELFARVDDALSFGAPFWQVYNYQTLLVNEPDGFRYNRPNVRFEKWKINNLGFRGGNFELQKPPGSFRIVCFGASESFGLYESEGGEWPSRLAKLLEGGSPSIQVINASVVGMSPEHHHAYLARQVWPLHPDMVILQAGFWSRAGQWGEVAPGDSHSANPNRKGPKRVNAPTLIEWLRFPPKLRSALKKHLPQQLVERIAIWQNEKGVMGAEQRRLSGRAPVDTVAMEALESFESDLEGLVRTVIDHGAIPVLSTSPFLIDSGNLANFKRELLDFRRNVVVLSEAGIVDAATRFNDRVRKFTTRNRVLLVDNEKVLPKTRAYFGDALHYTDAGAALIAENYLRHLTPVLGAKRRNSN